MRSPTGMPNTQLAIEGFVNQQFFKITQLALASVNANLILMKDSNTS
jgi:hypothetical protein